MAAAGFEEDPVTATVVVEPATTSAATVARARNSTRQLSYPDTPELEN
jgi:hypothetical protein